jgi:hypothetical protein
MSDVPPLNGPLVLLSACPQSHLSYVRKQCEGGNEVLLWLKFQWLAIYQWKAYATSDRKLIDFLNLHIPVRAFRINRNSQIFEKRLLDLSYEAGQKIKKFNKNGSK